MSTLEDSDNIAYVAFSSCWIYTASHNNCARSLQLVSCTLTTFLHSIITKVHAVYRPVSFFIVATVFLGFLTVGKTSNIYVLVSAFNIVFIWPI